MILDPFRCLISDTKLTQVLQLDQLMVTTMSSSEDNIVARGWVVQVLVQSLQLLANNFGPGYIIHCIVTSASVNGNLSSDTLLMWFGLLLIISDENNIVLIPRFNRFFV